jgi:hypothetical protein
MTFVNRPNCSLTVFFLQKFLISFVQNGIKCLEDDILIIYDENRNQIFDFCTSGNLNYLLVEGKFVFIRVATTAAHQVLLVFNFVNFETPSTFIPPTNSLTNSAEKKPLIGDCPSTPQRFFDSEATIEFSFFPNNRGSEISCNWLIEAEPNQRVQLDFEYISVPTQLNPFSTCGKEYLSISSYTRPNQSYKLCGARRSVKFIVTYHSVLLNLVTFINSNEEIGFKLRYKILKDQCWLILESIFNVFLKLLFFS